MTSRPILYAEDEPDDVFFLERALRAVGVEHRLIVVPDGQHVIDYLAGMGSYADRDTYPPPQLLLLDLNLPIKNGLEVLKWIGANPLHFTFPVIVFTSSSQEADRHRTLDLGACEFLVKPVDPKAFTEVVQLIRDRWLTGAPNSRNE